MKVKDGYTFTERSSQILKVLIKSQVNSLPALSEEPGGSDTEINMNQEQKWAEDDFDAPVGVPRLGHDEPVSGRKYIMYHGTTKKNAQSIQATGFRQSAGGMLGRGVYLSRDLQKASRYPIDHPESDRAVLKVSVDVGKVIGIRYQGHPRQRTWHDSAHGDVYDTAWVPPNCGMVKSGLEEDCVWDPNRIRIISIINPRPVERPRPVQPSSSWSGSGYSDWYPPFQHSCCLYGHQSESRWMENRWMDNRWMENRWMYPQFETAPRFLSNTGTDMNRQFQWLENDTDDDVHSEALDRVLTPKKTVKTRATTSKKKKKEKK